MNIKQMTHIKVAYRNGPCMAAIFQLPDGHYHVWFDPLTYHVEPTLYRNSLVERGQPGHFHAKKLDADAKTWAPFVSHLMAEVANKRLVDVALAKEQAAKIKESESFKQAAADEKCRDAATDLLAALKAIIDDADATRHLVPSQLADARAAIAKASP